MGGITLISRTSDILWVIATAARICYSGAPLEKLLEKREKGKDEDLVRKVVGMGHLSVAEHAVMTFRVDASFADELFEIMMDKPFLKISRIGDYFIVSVNLRTILELSVEKPELSFTKEITKFLPSFLKDQRVPS